MQDTVLSGRGGSGWHGVSLQPLGDDGRMTAAEQGLSRGDRYHQPELGVCSLQPASLLASHWC